MSILVNCTQCSKQIILSPSRFKKSKNAQFFCNKTCEGLHRTSQVLYPCFVCGKQIHLKPYKVASFKRGFKPCCSRSCDARKKEILYLGKGNPEYGKKGFSNVKTISDFKVSSFGYLLVRELIHPFRTKADFILFHRVIMENHLRANFPNSQYLISVDGFPLKYLNPFCVVHHKNRNRLDNCISNLEIHDSLGTHTSFHNNVFGHTVKDEISGRFVGGPLKVKKLINPNLIKKYQQDAAYDVVSNENKTISSQSSELFSTGLFIEVPLNHVGLLWSRSGLSINHKLEVGAGCIDANYRGEVKVHLYNFSTEEYTVAKGDRIAQLLIIPLNLNGYEEVEELSDSDRCLNGFGSTGN